MRQWDVLTDRGLAPTSGLDQIWNSTSEGILEEFLLSPVPAAGRRDVRWAEALINDSEWPLLSNLVPLMPVDERSFACVVLSDADADGGPLPGEGAVVRWHLDVRDERYQAALLDTDCLR